ncbi:MAG: hypothetical protein H0W70_02270 [Actinobacteria bacterium]|nr:hypothetical protein [Actinomycetota bacterium]
MSMQNREHANDDDKGDLSVRLEWPVDPLAAPVAENGADGDALERVIARLEAVESRELADGGGRSVLVAIDDLATRLDYVASEMAEALRSLNEIFRQAVDEQADGLGELRGLLHQSVEDNSDVARQLTDALNARFDETNSVVDDRVAGVRTALMAMLASREADEQRTQRREREALVGKVEEDLAAISRTMTEAIASSRAQSDVFADRVAAELQALRRRIPVKGRDVAVTTIDATAMDELVTRLADEVEIRVAAVTPKPARRKG